jgi:hypothetical protein
MLNKLLHRASAMQSNNRWFSLAGITLTHRIWLGLLIILASLLVLLFRPFNETRARYIVSRASHMPLLSAATLQLAEPDSEIVLEGQIGEGSQPQFRSFVAYVRETFVFKQGWSVQDRITPQLIITVPDGELRVINTDYSLLQRTLPVEWRPEFQRFSASEQYRGLVVGSHVTLFGAVKQDETGRAIQAEYVAGGS